MGPPKQKWTSEEEDALRAGVVKHGAGKWHTIQKVPEFSHRLATRSNIDLKDKWRNMSVSSGGQCSREKVRYTTMIIEALTTMQEANGSEIGAICHFIEQKHEVPPDFSNLLSSKLKRLVEQNKIEKVQNRHKPKQKDLVRPPQNSGLSSSTDLMVETATSAAHKIVDAEAKSFLASEAVKKISKMVEEADSRLLQAKERKERCMRGEVMTVAEEEE